ncbi:MAG: hypothetical protein ACOC0V_01960 [Oceanicaulis sp.]
MNRLIAGAVLGAAAFAGTALAGPPGRMDHRPVPPHSDLRGHCALQMNNIHLDAFAASANAAVWELQVNAPGLAVDQSGPVSGDPGRLERVSRILVSSGRYAPRFGRFSAGASVADELRPLRADLTVRDAAGDVVCTDRLHLRPGR